MAEQNPPRNPDDPYGAWDDDPYSYGGGQDGPYGDQPGRGGRYDAGQPGQPGQYGEPNESGSAPKKSWRERIFSNQSARYLTTGAPYHQLGEHASAGRLAQAAREFGWSITDTDEEADDLLVTAPFRQSGYRAGNVVKGTFDPFGSSDLGPTSWPFSAFDAVEDSRLGRTIAHCFTSSMTMLHLPPVRILPARFLTGPARGMKIFPTVDPIFDARFKLLARDGEDELDALTRLMTDEVRSVLSAGDDREEIWTIEGRLVVSTSQPHDEELLARHLEIIAAMLRAVRGQA